MFCTGKFIRIDSLLHSKENQKGENMRKLTDETRKVVMSVSADPDVKEVMDKERGLIKESTYVNHILRMYLTEKGLLPEKVHA